MVQLSRLLATFSSESGGRGATIRDFKSTSLGVDGRLLETFSGREF